MVVSQSSAAAAAGIAVLEAGGTAADAATACGFALAAVEPWNSGLGGIGFAVVHPAGAARAEVVDFGPVAPRRLDPSRFKLTGRQKRDLFTWPEVEGDTNVHGPLSAVVPSSVAGYGALHARWGRLPLADVMAPAIALARRGLPQDWYTTLKVANAATSLRLYPESARIYLPDGLPPVAPYQGAIGFFGLGRLADTLERLASAGLDDFYRGDIAASIVADLGAMGGIVSADDLAQCAARFVPAAETLWAGQIVQGAGGLTAFPTLAAVLSGLPSRTDAGHPDAAWFATLARRLRTAYAERLSGLGESEPRAAESCTTHVTVCDAEGTVIAMTTTLLSSMGSRVVLPGSGVLLNNGVMWFDPRPGTPNSMAPGKRPLTNMLPIIMRRTDGRPTLAAGASGGRRILAAVTQILAFVAGFGLSPEEAAHLPRIDVSGPDEVAADRRLSPNIIDALKAESPVTVVEHAAVPINFACPNMIALGDDGMRVGISDAASPWSAAVAEPG
jgi:gamma-glutamyltranspeptidase/glutathione hydrolase